ncbi:hypothetical protein Sjap_000672 [Stephania japonica]|uniref:Protein FLX-like 1 n=1 Tax=Stephania japonica TaxID=461633 RepID=A0AAP0KIJ1_9MAGN
MSGRNRGGPPHSMKGALPPIHDSPFGRPLPPIPHPGLLEDHHHHHHHHHLHRGGPMPMPMPMPMPLPPHPAAVLEDRLAVQHQEIQGLLVDNQRLAATHVALKQELEVAQHELRRMAHVAESVHVENDMQLREAYEKSMKMDADLRAADGMRAELLQVRADVQSIDAGRVELSNQVQVLTQELSRANAELQQVPALKAEIEATKQELQRARAAIEYEKKGQAESFEHGQAMQKNLIAMAREVEKLRSEIANAEKRARAAAAVGNPGASAGYGGNYGNADAGYGGNYGNADAGYGGNPYPAGYGINPVQSGAEGTAAQYGPGPGAWGAYDMQRTHGRR